MEKVELSDKFKEHHQLWNTQPPFYLRPVPGESITMQRFYAHIWEQAARLYSTFPRAQNYDQGRQWDFYGSAFRDVLSPWNRSLLKLRDRADQVCLFIGFNIHTIRHLLRKFDPQFIEWELDQAVRPTTK